MIGGMKHFSVWGIIGSLAFSSCICVQQWQEAQEMDAKYNAYVERSQAEDPFLASLKNAAAIATRAQIRVVWETAKEDTIIALGAEELAAVREMMPRMKEKPTLCRETWEERERETAGGMITLISYRCFGYLEFLNDKGEKITNYALEVTGIGTCEKAEEYTRSYDLWPNYMLPAADLARFNSLPAMVKYNKL